MVVEISAHHMVSINTTWGPCYHLEMMNAQRESQPSLTPPLHVMARHRGNPGSSPCLSWLDRGGATVFSMVFICNRVLTMQTCNLLDSHFLGPLVTKSRHLLGIYFYLHLFMFPGCCILLQVWGMRQKENPGNLLFCHSSDPKVPSLSAFLSSPFRMFVL